MSKARQLANLGNVYDDGALSHRNLIINGAMTVAQRGTSSTSVSSAGYYACDRYRAAFSRTQYVCTVSQDTSAPNGFASSYKITTTTAETTLDAGDQVNVSQRLEGQDLQRFKKGTADAEQFTVSFWVKSSIATTWSMALYDNDNSRQCSKTYTTNAANTWEYKTITFPADTTGSFDNDSAASLYFRFWLDGGTNYTSGTQQSSSWASYTAANEQYASTGFMTTANSTWQITGVQLEVGDTATPFEHRSYGDELQRCKRYYEGGTYAERNNSNNAGRWWADDGVENGNRAFPSDRKFAVEKRATPTLSIESAQTGTADKLSGYSSGTEYTCTSAPGTTRHTICNYFQMSGSGTGALPDQPVVAFIEVDAEL